MSDLISRQAAIDAVNAYFTLSEVSRTIQNMTSIQEMLEKMPSADVQPVQHGHWIWDKDGMDFSIGCWRCSVCGAKPATWWDTVESNPLDKIGSHYCGNCGAKMDGDEE